MTGAAPTDQPLSAVAVIPARYASQRLPGKLLLNETGKPLIQHVWERVRRAGRLDSVVVATDDERIRSAVEAFGGQVVMTRADHASGTDRVAEVAAGLSADVIINVQGDEPEIDPTDIDRLVERLETCDGDQMATLARPLGPDDGDILEDPSAVKLVFDDAQRALYFSRCPIPHGGDPAGAWLHLGVYAFRAEALRRFASAPPSPLEQRERLEQLRALGMGMPIGVVLTRNEALGIDTAADYARFVTHRSRLGLDA